MARTNQSCSDEFKREAVALVTSEHAITDVARELGIPHQTLWKWVDADRIRRVRTEQAAAGPIDPAAHAAALTPHFSSLSPPRVARSGPLDASGM